MPRRTQPHWTVYVGVALAVAGFIGTQVFTAIRWVYSVEQRFHDIDQRDRYLHGTFELPKETH